MHFCQLGKTNLSVSAIALGTVEIGMDYGIPDGDHKRSDEEQAIRHLQEALDLGVNFIDTARVYGNSEELIGRALKHRRDEYILATKIAPVNAGDLSGPGVRRKLWTSIQQSLRALQTDHIDILSIHSASPDVIRNASGLLELMREMQREGCARFLGASVYEEAGTAALHCGGFDCLQIAYNALDRSAEELTLPLARQMEVGIVLRSVLLKGALTARYQFLPESLSELKTAAAQLEGLARAAGITLPELAYRYVLPSDAVALCGTSRLEELKSAIAYAERGPLSADLVECIRRITVTDRGQLNPATWPF